MGISETTALRSSGVEKDRLPVTVSASGSGNASADLSAPGREIVIANDDPINNLTVVLTGPGGTLEFTLLPEEVLDERVPLFSSLAITATGAWRYWVRRDAPV